MFSRPKNLFSAQFKLENVYEITQETLARSSFDRVAPNYLLYFHISVYICYIK